MLLLDAKARAASVNANFYVWSEQGVTALPVPAKRRERPHGFCHEALRAVIIHNFTDPGFLVGIFFMLAALYIFLSFAPLIFL